MAHEITSTDDLFSVREPTWHRLGQVLDSYPTRAEAQQIAHPWEPITEPVYLSEPGFGYEEDANSDNLVPRMEYTEAPGHQAVRRSDNGDLLGIVGDGYVPIKNDEMWDIAEALQGVGSDVRFETGGSLAGGKKVWLMLRLEEPIHVTGDPNGGVIPFYSLQNAHDGSGSFRGQATSLRIVCANTSRAADLDARARGTEFSFRHSKNVRDRLEEAKAALAGWRESIEDWRLLNEHMLTVDIDAETEREFVSRFIPEPLTSMTSERVKANVDNARREFMGVYNGATCEGITGTAYGLIQAASEWSEHIRRANTEDTRFKRAVLSRNGVLTDAMKIVKDLTPA